MTRTLGAICFGETFELEILVDPVVEALGYDPCSDYVERFWLPVLGPSTTFLLRYFARLLGEKSPPLTLEVAEVAHDLGLGAQTGRNGPFLRSVARAIDFDMARLRSRRTIATRRALPPLARRHLVRLAPKRLAEHDVLRGPRRPTPPESRTVLGPAPVRLATRVVAETEEASRIA